MPTGKYENGMPQEAKDFQVQEPVLKENLENLKQNNNIEKESELDAIAMLIRQSSKEPLLEKINASIKPFDIKDDLYPDAVAGRFFSYDTTDELIRSLQSKIIYELSSKSHKDLTSLIETFNKYATQQEDYVLTGNHIPASDTWKKGFLARAMRDVIATDPNVKKYLELKTSI